MEEHPYVKLKQDHSGQRSTAIGLAAAALGIGIIVPVIGLWAVNKASESRSIAAMAGIGANTAAISGLNTQLGQERIASESRVANERASRESWQVSNQPSIKSYIDVQATPSAQSTSSAVADAYALAAAINNNSGINSAVSHDSFLKIARYAAPSPCPCDTCCGS